MYVYIEIRKWKFRKKERKRDLEKTRPQSQECPRVPQVLRWALKSEWTA